MFEQPIIYNKESSFNMMEHQTFLCNYVGLNRTFTDWLIGKMGTMEWLIRFLDLSQLTFYEVV